MARAELATEIPVLNFKFCTKTFQGRVKLNRHMNTHLRGDTGDLEAAFLNQNSSSHVSSAAPTAFQNIKQPHPQDSMKFNCAMCSMVFTDKSTLQEHTKMHLIEDAKAKFSGSSSSLSKEKKSITQGAPATDSKQLRYSYTCNLCNVTFLDNERWKVHKTSHGNKTWRCRFCALLLEDKYLLANHLQESHSVCQDEMDNMGLLKAVPLVIIKVVTESPEIKQSKEQSTDNEIYSEESEPETIDDPMPKHFDQDDAFFSNLSNLSRSDSLASLDLDCWSSSPARGKTCQCLY